MKKIYLTSLAATLLLTASCQTDFENSTQDIVITSGEANFSKYIALGNSLTSGFRDNALYIDGQIESYPNMLANQMRYAGGGDFTQPMMADNNGGLILGGNIIQGTKLYIEGFSNGNPVLKNVAVAPTTNVANKLTGTINNMGVPGAKSFHLVAPGYGDLAGLLKEIPTANPYYVRFSTSATSTVTGDAAAQKPTFFSLWIGNNDVLSYATGGGVGIDQTGNTNPTTYSSEDISDPNVVAGAIDGILATLKSAGSTKGVIANIPYVTTIPYFTTVGHNPLTPEKLGANIPVLNASLYGPLKNILTAYGQGDRLNLLSATSANPVLIKDKDLADFSKEIAQALTPTLGAATAAAFGQVFGQARQATVKDYVLLTASSVIGSANDKAPASININGVSFPLSDEFVLSEKEAAKVIAATDAYNTKISALANSYGLAFVDANKKMVELNSMGLQFDGVKYSAKFITGGAFSLDGVHLTGRGYAVVANEFIRSINKKYKSNLPYVNPNSYSGVKFP